MDTYRQRNLERVREIELASKHRRRDKDLAAFRAAERAARARYRQKHLKRLRAEGRERSRVYRERHPEKVRQIESRSKRKLREQDLEKFLDLQRQASRRRSQQQMLLRCIVNLVFHRPGGRKIRPSSLERTWALAKGQPAEWLPRLVRHVKVQLSRRFPVTLSDLDPASFASYASFKEAAISKGITCENAISFFRFRIEASVANFVALGRWWRFIEETGGDPLNGGRSTHWCRAVRRIGYEEMRPQIMERYFDRPTLFNRLGKLPLADQDRILADGGVRLAVYGPSGLTHIIADPAEMTPAQFEQAFDRDGLRSESGQALILAEKRQHQERKKQDLMTEFRGWQFDLETGIAKRGREVLTPEDIKGLYKLVRRVQLAKVPR